MANPDVSPHLITQFSDMVHVQAQQKQSRLRPHLRTIKIVGDDYAYDGLGDVDAIEQNSSHQAVQFQDIEHLRRQIPRTRFVVNLPIDGKDKLGMLLDPNKMYAEAVANAMARVYDKVAIAAAFATVNTGRNFGTAVTAAADGVATVDATAGLTYEKLLEINRTFKNNEVGTNFKCKKMLLFTGDEEQDLMGEAELTSGDFSRSLAVDNGEMVKAAGFDLIPYGAAIANPLLAVNTNVRDCIAIAENGICVGISKDIEIKIQERPDLEGTWQVKATFILGAVRTEGKLVQKVQTTEK